MASRTVSRLARLSRCAHVVQPMARASLVRPAISWRVPLAIRPVHSNPRPWAVDGDASDASDASNVSDVGNTTNTSDSPTGLAPHYELTFTCVPCGERSSHKVSKQGYHQGSVLITCPSCRNRHVITDHLGLFGGARSLEEIVRERGQLVKRGTLGEDGDIEFWEDGTESRREERLATEGVVQPKRSEGENSADAVPGSTFK